MGLRGQVLPYGDPQRADTVQVLFEPTTLTIANSLHLRIGEGQGRAQAATQVYPPWWGEIGNLLFCLLSQLRLAAPRIP